MMGAGAISVGAKIAKTYLAKSKGKKQGTFLGKVGAFASELSSKFGSEDPSLEADTSAEDKGQEKSFMGIKGKKEKEAEAAALAAEQAALEKEKKNKTTMMIVAGAALLWFLMKKKK